MAFARIKPTLTKDEILDLFPREYADYVNRRIDNLWDSFLWHQVSRMADIFSSEFDCDTGRGTIDGRYQGHDFYVESETETECLQDIIALIGYYQKCKTRKA